MDIGIQQDFDNMTKEIGRTILVYGRIEELTYEGQEAESDEREPGVEEVAFVQELDITHEVVSSGQMNVGDIRCTFQHDSSVVEECFISKDGGVTLFKILKVTKVRNQSNNAILEIKAFGKKVPRR